MSLTRLTGALPVLLAALLTSSCALAPAPIVNPNLQTEGQIAVRGTQLVAVIRTAQLALEPLVDARVVTAAEAVKVAESLGAVLQTCDALVSALRVADATRDAVERVQALRDAGQRAREALQTLTGITGHISGDAGKLAVGAATTKVINAVADLVPALGGTQ